MSEKQNRELPYKALGTWLKRIREKKQKSLAEVSGAVEIENDFLIDIERGKKRPSEDILMLLISYFAIKEDDAVKAWELAGYTSRDDEASKAAKNEEPLQPVIVMPMDIRVVYTDLAHIKNNQYGLVIDFMQADGIGNKPLSVSRVGMSHEHAQKLLNALGKSLKPPQRKLLPAPESDNTDKKEQKG